MATIAQQLAALKTWRNQLAANLTTKGVAASNTEKLNTLVPKVLQIPTGIDTSDATATAADLLSGKTAYVNGEKLTGTVATLESVSQKSAHYSNDAANQQIAYEMKFKETGYFTTDTVLENGMKYSAIAGVIGLQPEQIADGVTVLGVTGTYTGGGTSDTSILYDATHRNGVYLKYNDTVYSVDSFAAEHADFCSEANEYALNYSNMIFEWDTQVYSCCITPIHVTENTKIAINALSGSTEDGVVRLVQSSTGTASDIIEKAQTEGSYVDLSYQWVQTSNYITTLVHCGNATAGTYYLCWIGRSNNSHPKIKSITVM